MTTYKVPLLNLKAVVQETGVHEDTLRTWERRYDLPQPERTDSGQRLYSRRDVDIVKWLTARQREGLTIGRAVALWRQLESKDRDPLLTPFPAAAPSPAANTPTELRQSWLVACLAFDEQGAERILNRAFAHYPLETVCTELLQAGLAEIGQRWYEGQITVQQEHFASALALRRLEALLLAAPPPTRPARILVACPPGEEHTFPCMLTTFLLRRRGWEAIHLGANVPLAQLEQTTTVTRPRLVILSAQRLPTAATLAEMSRFLHHAGIAVAFAGGVFDRLPRLGEQIAGNFLGRELEMAPRAVERLIETAPAPLPCESGPARPALDNYRQQRAVIEADLWGKMGKRLPHDCLTHLNEEFGDHAEAALAFDDVGLLDAYVEWREGLQSESRIPPDWFADYLAAYYQATQAHLDGPAKSLVNWLAEKTSRG
ncbi:MAG: B12-binding domain-containing protein [Anaerolineae bacterium]|nr:B12-binding domain-containing protein [Anaerolineae bacterium]